MNWYKTAKPVNGHSYSWVYIDLPENVQSSILECGKQIDPDDLYVKEANNGLEDEPHVTVKYGLLTEDAKDIRECLDEAKGGNVYLGKSSIFECDEYDVVKVSVESKALDKLHEKLNCLPHEDKYMEYKPHATIAYVKKGCGKKYDGKFSINEEFRVREVFFGNNGKRDFKIKVSTNWYSLYKTAKSITLYQGRSVHNKGSKFWTTKKEWARNFTQSGRDSEIATIKIDDASIYSHNPLPQATNPDEIDQVVAIAESNGFNAILVNEGVNEPNSVLIFGEIAKPMSQRDVDKWHKVWDRQEGK